MTDATKVALEAKAMLIDSEHFHDVTYAIDREGNGMWLLVKGKEIAISDPVTFVQEMFEVWQHMKPKGVKL